MHVFVILLYLFSFSWITKCTNTVCLQLGFIKLNIKSKKIDIKWKPYVFSVMLQFFSHSSYVKYVRRQGRP